MNVPIEQINVGNDILLEIVAVQAGEPYSWENEKDPTNRPARIDVGYEEVSNDSAFSLTSPIQADALIAVLQRFRKAVWGD